MMQRAPVVRSTLDVERMDGTWTTMTDIGPEEAEYLLRSSARVYLREMGRYAPGSYDHDSGEGHRMRKLFPNMNTGERTK